VKLKKIKLKDEKTKLRVFEVYEVITKAMTIQWSRLNKVFQKKNSSYEVKKIHVFTQIRVHFFKTHSFKCQNHTFIPYEFLIFKTAFLKLYIYIYITF
jgi:hypothetical protein